MENTITTNHIKTSDINHQLIISTISKIETFIFDKNYQFKDRKGLEEITTSKFNNAFINLSKRKRKRLASYIWAANNRLTLGGVNKFFHFLMKNILQSDLRIRITKSAKELAIQYKRGIYIEVLAKAKEAYADYKTEKGDFYKVKSSEHNCPAF